jgi:colicin import membrane protein
MQLATIPRTYVKVVLRTARLPIAAAERIAGRDDDKSWPPVLAFDGLAANVEQIVGSMLRDDELERHGRLEQTRVAELRDAARLETLAEQTEEEAAHAFESRREADERKRQQAAKRAKERETAAERDKQQAKAAAEKKQAEERARAHEADREREAALAKKERAAKQASIAKERQAVDKAKAATEKKAQALDADKKIEANKARRSA